MEHATRMILIPEELYDSLLSQRSSAGAANPIDSHLYAAAHDLDRLRTTPALNDAQKYALYNAEFKRLQHLKDERVERAPAANVNIKSGAPPPPSTDVSAIANAMKEALVSMQQQLHKRPKLSSSSSYESANSSRSHITDEEEEEEEEKTPARRVNPPRHASLKEKREEADEKVDEIVRVMQRNRKTLGIDDKGRILDSNNQPINQSDYRDAARRLVYPSAQSPPGMRTLRTKFSKLPEAKQLLAQTGKGIKVATVVAKQKPVVFRPQLWPPMKF